MKKKRHNLFMFGEEKVRHRLNAIRAHLKELEIAWHSAPEDFEPLARTLLKWLASWAGARAEGGSLVDEPPNYSVAGHGGGFTAKLLARFGEIHRITKDLDRLLPGAAPSGAFELLRLHHRVHELLAGEQLDWALLADSTDTPEGRRKTDRKVFDQLKEDRHQRLTAIVEVLHERGPLTEAEIVEKVSARRAVTGSS